ncbi:MAG: hypothetical protein ACJ0RL_04980 [Porticoccaceae bacterium]
MQYVKASQLRALHIPASWYRLLLLLALSLFFVNVGVDHFVNPDFYLNIMPDYLPFHAEAVYLSGFFEILGGIARSHPKIACFSEMGPDFPANSCISSQYIYGYESQFISRIFAGASLFQASPPVCLYFLGIKSN